MTQTNIFVNLVVLPCASEMSDFMYINKHTGYCDIDTRTVTSRSENVRYSTYQLPNYTNIIPSYWSSVIITIIILYFFPLLSCSPLTHKATSVVNEDITLIRQLVV